MREHAHFTYILASRSRTLYVKEHRGFTARYNCDRLLWFERFQYVQLAIAREKELKAWRRAKDCAYRDVKLCLGRSQPRLV